MLVPGLEYTFETLVESLSDMGISDQVRSLSFLSDGVFSRPLFFFSRKVCQVRAKVAA